MDNPGWHAIHRANRDSLRTVRGPDGHFQPVQPQVEPLREDFIGGFRSQVADDADRPPAPPPKDTGIRSLGSGFVAQDGARSRSLSSPQSPRGLSAVQRTKAYRTAHMNPALQFMVGPLLRYDTVDNEGIWHGAALIVCEAGSYSTRLSFA